MVFCKKIHRKTQGLARDPAAECAAPQRAVTPAGRCAGGHLLALLGPRKAGAAAGEPKSHMESRPLSLRLCVCVWLRLRWLRPRAPSLPCGCLYAHRWRMHLSVSQ